jgi:YgiT-type zinc finger domain-containing protein
MNCRVCGSSMRNVVTDLPFKATDTTIVILKDLPVIQCGGCGEFLIEEPVREQLDAILERSDTCAELEIVRYAA